MGRVSNAPKTVKFRRDGNIEVVIVDFDLAEPRFSQDDPNAFDVCLKVKAIDSEECDWWYGEYSNAYGKGNHSDKTRKELTTATLERIGLKNGDLTQLPSLIGSKTIAWVKKTEKEDGKVFYNVAGLGSSGGEEPTSLSPEELNRRFSALLSGAAPKPTFNGGNGNGATTNPFVGGATSSQMINPFLNNTTSVQRPPF